MTPKIKKMDFADTVKAKAESELQKLLIESPSLVTIDEIRDGASSLVLAVGEFGLILKEYFGQKMQGKQFFILYFSISVLSL